MNTKKRRCDFCRYKTLPYPPDKTKCSGCCKLYPQKTIESEIKSGLDEFVKDDLIEISFEEMKQKHSMLVSQGLNSKAGDLFLRFFDGKQVPPELKRGLMFSRGMKLVHQLQTQGKMKAASILLKNITNKMDIDPWWGMK